MSPLASRHGIFRNTFHDLGIIEVSHTDAGRGILDDGRASKLTCEFAGNWQSRNAQIVRPDEDHILNSATTSTMFAG